MTTPLIVEPGDFALKRGTAAAWISANPVLPAGVEGFETDTLKRKVGDGVTAWTGLAYPSTTNDLSVTDNGDGTWTISSATTDVVNNGDGTWTIG